MVYNYQIRKLISENELDKVFKVAEEVYRPIYGFSPVCWSRLNSLTDFDISYVAVDNNDQPIGFYLLQQQEMPRCRNSSFDYRRISGLIGVKGSALGLKKEYRGLGIGKQLINIPRNLNFGYVWGGQDRKLNNLHHWLKRRELVAQDNETNITIEIFKN